MNKFTLLVSLQVVHDEPSMQVSQIVRQIKHEEPDKYLPLIH